MSTLLARTDHGLLRVTEEGRGWSAATLHSTALAQCVAVDPSDASTIYLGTRGEGVWKSRDAGRSWMRLGLPAGDVFALAVSRADGGVYAGCEPSRLFVSRDGGDAWRELEGLVRLPSAPTWSFPPRPWTSHVSSIAPHPRDADVLLVGIELGGLMRSDDGGETWQDHRPGAQRDVHALAWHPRATDHAYQAAGGGTARSIDRGRTWLPADEGRGRTYCWGLAVDDAEVDTWYVSASPGPGAAHGERQADASVYRWRDDGPWQPIVDGLPEPLHDMPYALVVHGGRLFVGLRGGRVFVSDDQGDRWHELPITGASRRGLRALIPG